MPYANLHIKGQKNLSPRKEAPVLDKPSTPEQVNIFNAVMGAPFKCNVCNESHRKHSDWILATCFNRGFNKTKSNIEIKPFGLPVEIETTRECRKNRGSYDGMLATISIRLFHKIDHLFHPWGLALSPEFTRSITHSIKNTTVLKKIIASDDYGKAFSDYFRTIPEYCQIIKEIDQTKNLLARNEFDFTKIPGLRIDQRCITRSAEEGYHYPPFSFDNIISYYMPLIQSISIESSFHKIEKHNIYLFFRPEEENVGHSARLLVRINPLNDYVPKTGLWSNIDEALSACPPESWQVFRKIEF